MGEELTRAATKAQQKFPENHMEIRGKRLFNAVELISHLIEFMYQLRDAAVGICIREKNMSSTTIFSTIVDGFLLSLVVDEFCNYNL
ncbi:hypothetical protein QVD17_12278 [Tagetes erecta]|uniref:Uncharacterized protein n=1 Tax=Tagetes erecta TaxID=13708 RepID=A0AAD8L0X8_TARER|nr:hypothetical protein QVD17_12278 [Tagetes erecta]